MSQYYNSKFLYLALQFSFLWMWSIQNQNDDLKVYQFLNPDCFKPWTYPPWYYGMNESWYPEFSGCTLMQFCYVTLSRWLCSSFFKAFVSWYWKLELKESAPCLLTSQWDCKYFRESCNERVVLNMNMGLYIFNDSSRVQKNSDMLFLCPLP